MRTYKYICKKCHKRQTNSPDRLCSKCRTAAKTATKPCIICGVTRTASPDGVCWRCKKKAPVGKFDENELIKEAISRCKRDLMVLNHRLDGISYGKIAKITGIPVATCHSIVARATRDLSISNSPNWAYDYADDYAGDDKDDDENNGEE